MNSILNPDPAMNTVSTKTSTLVAGLLSLVTLGTALAGAYLLAAPLMEENE